MEVYTVTIDITDPLCSFPGDYFHSFTLSWFSAPVRLGLDIGVKPGSRRSDVGKHRI